MRGRHNLDLAFDHIPVVLIVGDRVCDAFPLAKTIENLAFRIILDEGIDTRVLKPHVLPPLQSRTESVICLNTDVLVGNVYAQNAQSPDERQHISINVEL